MVADDLSYFQKRAEKELEMARKADTLGAVKAHYRLATFYLDRVHGDESLPARLPDDQPC